MLRDMETSVLTLVIVAGLSGLYSGWVDWRTEVHDLDVPWWRRTSATVGLLTVTMQAFLFLALLTIMGGHAGSISCVCEGSAFAPNPVLARPRRHGLNRL